MIFKSLDYIQYDSIKCQQCGACISVCKKKAIDYSINTETGLLDIQVNHNKCVKCSICYDICPANKDTHIDDVNLFVQNRDFYIGHSKNKEVRRKSSSGGVVKTIIIEGLKSGFFDGVYTLKKKCEYPFAEGYFFTIDNIPDYNDIPNSVYHSVPLNLNLEQIKKCNRLLVVGTACQLSALKKYAEARCNELYSICIFCKQQKKFNSTRFLAKMAGESIHDFSDIKDVEYRGEAWPGRCKFNSKKLAWEKAATLPFGKKLWCVPGCDVCGNPYGKDTDITVMDPWWLNVDRTLGETLFSINTERGKLLLNIFVHNIECTKKSVAEVTPALSISDLNRKNELIPYFRGEAISDELRRKGDRFVRRRKVLEKILSFLPKMPKLFYKLLNRLFTV